MTPSVVALLALALLGAPLVAEAQSAGRVHRIGVLLPSVPGSPTAAFRDGLRELGYVEGLNLVLEVRSVEGRLERLPELAQELVSLKVDVIDAGGSPSLRAARQATATIPTVVVSGNQLVEDGVVGQPGSTRRQCYGVDRY